MGNSDVVFGAVERLHDVAVVTVHSGGQFLGCLVEMDDHCWEGSKGLHASLSQSSYKGMGSGSDLAEAKAVCLRLWEEVLEERRENAEYEGKRALEEVEELKLGKSVVYGKDVRVGNGVVCFKHRNTGCVDVFFDGKHEGHISRDSVMEEDEDEGYEYWGLSRHLSRWYGADYIGGFDSIEKAMGYVLYGWILEDKEEVSV